MRYQNDVCMQHILGPTVDLLMFAIVTPFSVNNICSHGRPIATIVSLIWCVFNNYTLIVDWFVHIDCAQPILTHQSKFTIFVESVPSTFLHT